MKRIAINTDREGVAKVVVAGYYKFGAATLLNWGGATGTAIIEIYEDSDLPEGQD